MYLFFPLADQISIWAAVWPLKASATKTSFTNFSKEHVWSCKSERLYALNRIIIRQVSTPLSYVGPIWTYMNTVKPVCNDHLYNKIYYLWSIQ